MVVLSRHQYVQLYIHIRTQILLLFGTHWSEMEATTIVCRTHILFSLITYSWFQFFYICPTDSGFSDISSPYGRFDCVRFLLRLFIYLFLILLCDINVEFFFFTITFYLSILPVCNAIWPPLPLLLSPSFCFALSLSVSSSLLSVQYKFVTYPHSLRSHCPYYLTSFRRCGSICLCGMPLLLLEQFLLFIVFLVAIHWGNANTHIRHTSSV